ncbi:MAG: hypothetical protein WCV99_11100 [Sterolibacterium sp.]|jgi:hypothetical protein
MAEQQGVSQQTVGELIKARLKERSPNFPFIALEASLKRAQELYDKEKRGAAPAAIVADHWGYSESSSSAQQTIGALRAYGLLDDDGKGTARRLKLSEAALRILLDSRPDSSERDQLKREAAKRPAIFTDIYERWPDTAPSDPNLRHYLIFDRKFSEEAAKKASLIFFDNEIFTKCYGRIVTSGETTNNTEVIDVQTDELSLDKPKLAPQVQQVSPLGGLTTGFRQDVFSLDEGPIVLRWPEKLSAESYEDFESWIQLQLRKIKRSITP